MLRYGASWCRQARLPLQHRNDVQTPQLAARTHAHVNLGHPCHKPLDILHGPCIGQGQLQCAACRLELDRLAACSQHPVMPNPLDASGQHMPADPATTAHELFATLRALDARGVQEIWLERPPEDSAWDGVRDRVQRAAA